MLRESCHERIVKGGIMKIIEVTEVFKITSFSQMPL